MKRIGLFIMTFCLAVSGTAQLEYLVNPSCVALGETGVFKIDVKPDSISDDMIVWEDNSGHLSFPNGNKGRLVTVKGETPGDFKLSVRIGNIVNNQGPHIFGTVKPSTVTALHFFVITSNGVHAVSQEMIDRWTATANRAYRQAAMSFYKASVTYVEKPEWFHVTDFDQVDNIVDHARGTGGLEVYCVSTFFGGIHGVNRADGMVIKATEKDFVLAHEIGHACGLDDIAEVFVGDALVSEDLVRSKNWSGGPGTGHYPKDLKHQDLIRRLLMYYSVIREDTAVSIPLEDVKGNMVRTGVPVNSSPMIRNVGVESMNRNPRHN